MKDRKWYEIDDVENIISPALVVYPDRIEENIKLMIQIAGGTDSLRPHIKTHKIAELIEMQLRYDISKFKCATIVEAELLAECGARDILLAMQPIGKNIDRFFELISRFPNSKFSTLVDCEEVFQEIENSAKAKNTRIDIWMDINNGMDRTGILPNNEAAMLYQKIEKSPYLGAKGLHVYDGHIHEPNIKLRKEICDKAFDLVLGLKSELELSGINIETMVVGGTPTFPIHAKRSNVEVSPGTPLLWDQGYADTYKDLEFLPAAVLIGNVVSKPKANYICLNLGHKSVAAEMPFPRMKILNIERCEQISHSEEHLVVECYESEKYLVGTVCYAIPTHICPTVVKYKEVLNVVDGKVTGSWKIAARDHIQ